jgi:hypothetical protein
LKTVKAALRAYVDKDRASIEHLVANDYRFTSSLDNAIDREAYFERCCPNSEGTTSMTFIDGPEHDEVAWIIYDGKHAGKRLRNCEYHRVRNGQLIETEVYFWVGPAAQGRGRWTRVRDQRR